MTKALEDMSLEELWQLFPIFLREHQVEWKDWYEEERLRLLSFLPEHQIVCLSHIGSTSVETIWAKPIVDIMLEIPKKIDMAVMRDLLLQNGYLLMSESQGRMSFNMATHRVVLPSAFSICIFAMRVITMSFTLETICRNILLLLRTMNSSNFLCGNSMNTIVMPIQTPRRFLSGNTPRKLKSFMAEDMRGKSYDLSCDNSPSDYSAFSLLNLPI